MSSPRSGGVPVREGTRVVLREITATLHNSPPMHSARLKSGNDNSLPKTPEHEVKVRFAREFADVGSITYSAPESLSSASSFHSLSSTLSTKSSSGICADSVPPSPNEVSNTSYLSSSIPGVDDLIEACAGIQLNGDDDPSFVAHENSQNLSQDQTFTSANEGPVADITNDFPDDEISLENFKDITTILGGSSTTHNCTQEVLDCTRDIEEQPVLGETLVRDSWSVVPYIPIIKLNNIVVKEEEQTKEIVFTSVHNHTDCNSTIDLEDSLPRCDVEESNFNSTVCLSPNHSAPIVIEAEEQIVVENKSNSEESSIPNVAVSITINSIPSVSLTENEQELSLPSISSFIEESGITLDEIDTEKLAESVKNENSLKNSVTEEKENTSGTQLEILPLSSCNTTNIKENSTNSLDNSPRIIEETPVEVEKDLEANPQGEVENTSNNIDVEKNSPDDELDTTLTLEDDCGNSETVPEIEQYTEFQPQRQSTTLALVNEHPNFDELKCAADKIADDIFTSALELSDETDRFTSATSELFQDPTSFDFLLTRGNSKITNRLRAESLYVKFDPLVFDTSMLPQGNAQPTNQEQNGKNENPLPNVVGTPKRNPAIAAIDRLLFYSPLSTSTIQKMDEPQEKIEQPTEESKPDSALIADINMSKELELVRATVLQLEEELEKQKKEYEAELERQKTAFQEKLNKLQAQIAQEVKSKSQMTVVVDEYEKSISRLLTERERDRTNFEQEKAKLQEELQATNVHLTNTEAAFNDVHQKYEKVKGVVSAYKSNETVLKESIEENMETIKGLETRYDQLKNHAMSQLEKANFELDAMRKQHADETVKLHAMIRKAELKSNSLAELVDQKTKENKELTQILDEVIARVGHQNAE